MVFNQEWNFVGQAKLDRLGETGSLAEVDEIFEGECQRDGFGEFDFDIHLWLLDVAVWSQSDCTVTDITSTGELDTIL